VVALVAARDEADRIVATVTALRSIEAVAGVVVVDDGSRDETAALARSAGARVLRSSRPLGKGGALEHALGLVEAADVFLLVDGDVGPSATHAERLLEPVLRGDAEFVVGILPRPPTGGFGLVRSFAGRAIRRLSGFAAREPLSGQRAVTRECAEACRPLAAGFGLETAMTADAARLGFRISELPVAVEHRFTRRDAAGFIHRGRQGAHIVRALAPRLLGMR
jgi:glycosyltransferase involved in cell wall biosynthesis